MPTIPRKPRILLTEDDVNGWRNEAQEILARIRKDQGRLAELNRKLEFAALLAKAGGQEELPYKPQTVIGEAFANAPMTEAVPAILASTHRPMKPREIKKALSARGFTEEQLGNYFYTVLMRLSKRGTILKQNGGYTVLQESEAADDTRSVNGSSTASSEHRQTSGETHGGPVNPRPGGGK
jgi:hypothetical protein